MLHDHLTYIVVVHPSIGIVMYTYVTIKLSNINNIDMPTSYVPHYMHCLTPDGPVIATTLLALAFIIAVVVIIILLSIVICRNEKYCTYNLLNGKNINNN